MKSNNSKLIYLFDIPINAYSMDETLDKIDKAIQYRSQIHHVAVNAAKIVKMQKNPQLRESVINCDIINADGQSVVWASKILRKPLPERVAGIDLMQRVIELAHKKKYRVFFLGAEKCVLDKVINNYKDKYSAKIIAGYRDGYFSDYEDAQVAEEIGKSGADILFVAITSPKKEIFLYRNRERLENVSFIMGVGGSFDVIAGKVKRAPEWMQKIGMEWFYRVIQEPGRMWKRYFFTNTQFMILVIKTFLRKK